MLVLGIETSCDETSAAIADETGQVRAVLIASQLKLHQPYGGVVPELASRQHIRDLPEMVSGVLKQAGLTWDLIEGVAATFGPGLMGALLVGLSYAKSVALARQLPFIGINHLEGHLIAPELNHHPIPKPFVGLIASGGHTNLYLVSEGDSSPPYTLLASTRDDAVGEAFDKVAKLLGLSYPGGPAIEQAANQATATIEPFSLPRMKDGSIQFSYSGLKTAVRYLVEKQKQTGEPVAVNNIAAAFQSAVIKDLVTKTIALVKRHHARGLVLTGGVAANQGLRTALAAAAEQINLPFFVPPIKWCTDNAAMIAVAGAKRLAAGERSPLDLAANPNAPLH